MNKSELVKEISEKSGLNRRDADKAVTAIVDVITESVKRGERVQLVGFGTFEARMRNERAGRDPRTNEPIVIPAARVPAFKVGKGFKEAVASD